MLLSPWTVILSIGFIFYYLGSREHNETNFYFLSVLIFSFFIFNIFSKNVRYVIMLDIPMRLFSVLMLRNLIENALAKKNGQGFANA